MSYILEALRRAEADRERERGQVPGLHTLPTPGRAAAPATGPRRWLPWAGGGLLLLAGMGAGSWWAGSAGDTPPLAPPVAPAPQVAAMPAAADATATVAVPSPTTPPALSAEAAVPAAPVAPHTARPSRTAGASPAPLAEARIPPLSELPDSTRSALPKLALGGSVYSDDPANRMVIINGEVLHEGARLGADLVLEQIRPRELVLRFKGQRFRQPV